MSFEKIFQKLGIAVMLVAGLLAIAPVTFAENEPPQDKNEMMDGMFDDFENWDMEDMKDGMKGMMDNSGATYFWGEKGVPFAQDQVYLPDRLPFDIEEFTGLISEIEKIFAEYDAQDAKMSMEMDNDLNNFRDKSAKFLAHPALKAIADNKLSPISEEFKTLLNQYDQDELDDTIDEIAKFWGTGPWKAVQEAWDNLYGYEMMDEMPDEEDFKDYYDEVGDEFIDELTAGIEKEFLDEVMRAVNNQLMIELANYFDDQTTKDMIERIMGSINVFGEDFGNELLENQAYVLKRVEKFDPKEADYKRDTINDLYERSKNIVVPDKYKEELANIWFNLENIFGDESVQMDKTTKDAIDDYITRLEKLFKEIDHENVFGEKPVEFYDVKFNDDAWYWGPVVSARNRGIVNGYRDENGLTGYFGPGDNVTYAQALKMTMEAAGYHEEPNDSEIWYQDYLDGLNDLNLEELDSATYDNWDAPAKRGDIILMVNRVFDIEPVEYEEGTFNDVQPGDPLADDAMASSLEGIFTGEGETGNLNPDGDINRAGFAKVTEEAMKYLESTKVADELETSTEGL